MIELKHVSKCYQDKPALTDISAIIKEREVTVLFGPSGSGKSTLLRLLAGLEMPDHGRISNPFPTCTLCFQEGLLQPDLSGQANILYGLDVRRFDELQRAVRLKETAQMCQCTDFLSQKTGTLSGGQKQRIALARAIISCPSLLLLDEPFSQMDHALAEKLLLDLLGWAKENEITIVFVTHDRDLAKLAGGPIIHLDHGRIKEMEKQNERA